MTDPQGTDHQITLSGLLAEIAEEGWLVNNLFQLDPETWQCNLRTQDPIETRFTVWGVGPTPELALLDTISKGWSLKKKLSSDTSSPSDLSAYDNGMSETPVRPLSELLGTRKSVTRIRRRI